MLSSPYTTYLIGLWPLILGLHRPCSQHATVPSTLSSEGQLLVYPPRFSGLTPTGERDSCATWAQYYGDSVPMRLAPGRGSRVPSREDVRAQRRCLIHYLHETSLVPILSLRVLRTATLSRVAKGSGLKRSARGCVLPSSVIEVRAILLSPYCAELASLKLQRFRFSLAFTACCCSLFLSEPGQPVFLKPPSSSSRLRRRSHRA